MSSVALTLMGGREAGGMSVVGFSSTKGRGLGQAPLLLGQLLRNKQHSLPNCGEFSPPLFPKNVITVKAQHIIKLCP